MPTITPGCHNLQIWSAENDYLKPDFFRLEDGRTVEIKPGNYLSASRVEYAVAIKHDSYGSRAFDEEAHRHVEGHAGWMIKNWRLGDWLLFPTERAVNSVHARGVSTPYRIKADVKATARTAALELIELSDRLQRRNHAFCRSLPLTRKAGSWEINALALDADGVDLPQEPSSVRLDLDRVRHYCARHDKHGAIRVIAEKKRLSTGYSLGIRILPSPGLVGCTGKVQTVPARIERWIESRIHSI